MDAYPAVPKPATVEISCEVETLPAALARAAAIDVENVEIVAPTNDVDAYPADPKPIILDVRLREEIAFRLLRPAPFPLNRLA